MLDPEHALSVARQCRLLSLSRSTAYYRPKGENEENLAIMEMIDRIYMERPTDGSRTIKTKLEGQGVRIARSRVVRLMRLMGIRAIHPKPRLSSPGRGHKVYPYLLREIEVSSPRQVYAADITYIPMAKGFLYLVAVIDWRSRKVLAHRLSNTLEADFCVEAAQEAIARYGAPEVFNTDQGSQFTSEAFTSALKERGVAISMDGKGCWRDNVYVERLWRSLKQEEVYRYAYETVAEARKGIAGYLRYFNEERPHQGLDNLTPDDVFYQRKPLAEAA